MTSLHHQWLPHFFTIFLIILHSSSSAAAISSAEASPLIRKFPKLGIIQRDGDDDQSRHPINGSKTSLPSKDFKPHFYKQSLDHFNYYPDSYDKFKQYYVINSKYWGGSKSSSPIFAYLGAEGALDRDIPVVGFLTDNARRFKALLVYIEHRFYGKSNPLGSMELTLESAEIRGYFNSAQALADYAEILLHVKRKLKARHSPIIVIGGSYGGMLASWFRLKYPHIALGALASSAPILYFDNLTPQDAYYTKVTEDFKAVSENCYESIRKSWSEIDKLASESNGLTILSQRFRTCRHLNTSSELTDYLDSLYATASQYNAPPKYPVAQFCKGVDNLPRRSGILDRIYEGLVSLKGGHNNNISCYDTSQFSYPTETALGWTWQTCSEIVIPIGRSSNDTMFPAAPFVLKDYMTICKSIFGVSPRPHWITTYYGGHDIKLVLKRYGSNIIFSNGLKDPYSTGGVLENLSRSLVAVHTKNGSHCLDILSSKKSDPDWLIAQRKVEVQIIDAWINSYYADLATLQKK